MKNFFAYLDAGTGSLILQAIGGAFITAIVFIKSFGHKIRKLFSFGKKTVVDTSEKPTK